MRSNLSRSRSEKLGVVLTFPGLDRFPYACCTGSVSAPTHVSCHDGDGGGERWRLVAGQAEQSSELPQARSGRR